MLRLTAHKRKLTAARVTKKMNLTTIDGIIAAGKTFLLDLLKNDDRLTADLTSVQFIEEPLEKFRTYQNFNPLR